MIKPGFDSVTDIVKDGIVNDLNLKIIDEDKVKYTKEAAREHYINLSNKPFYDEVVDYLTSYMSYGLVVVGNEAIDKCRKYVEGLRKTLPDKLGLKTDVMRNIVHCSSKGHKDEDDEIAKREIKIFNSLKSKVQI